MCPSTLMRASLIQAWKLMRASLIQAWKRSNAEFAKHVHCTCSRGSYYMFIVVGGGACGQCKPRSCLRGLLI